jgi:hypothetical protein
VNKTVIGVLIAAATTVGPMAFAQAPGPDPTWTPPPAASEPPPPPQAQAAPYQYGYGAPAPAATVAAPAQAGQWVYTNQYGWIWMPYGANYTYVAGPDAAYSYAYYPRFGWRWVSSPWVLSVGPSPFWGRLGPSHYAWYGHPYNRGRVVVRAGGWYGRPAAPAPRVAWHGGAVGAVRGRTVGHRR